MGKCKEYNGEVRLGYGYDYATGSVRSTRAREDNMGYMEKGKAVKGVDVINSRYEDYSSYTKGIKDSSEIKEYAAALKLGVRVGIVKAELEAAFNKTDGSATSSLSIEKKVGITREKTYKLPYSYDFSSYNIVKPNTDSQIITREILLNSLGERAITYLENIGKNGDDKKALVDLFYKEYGTHVITSVTKGQVGYYHATMGAKKEAEESIFGMQAKIKFSALMISGSASYSQSSRTSSSQSNYNIETVTCVTPENASLIKALNEKKKDLENLILDANNQGLEKETKIPGREDIKLKFPVLPDSPKLDEIALIKAEDKRIISKIKNIFKDLKKIEVTSEKPKDLKKKIEKLCEKLNDKVGQIKEEKLRKKDKLTVEKAEKIIELLNDCEVDSDLKREDFKKVQNDIKKIIGEKLLYNAPTGYQFKSFSNWLSEKQLDHNILTAKDLVVENKEWHSYLLKNNYMSEEKYLSKIDQNYTGVYNTPILQEEKDAEFNDFAVLDFAHVPWIEIFPELGSSLVIDELNYILLKKILVTATDFMLDYAYLNLVIQKTSTTKSLENLRDADKGIHKKLTTFISSLAGVNLKKDVNCSAFNGESSSGLDKCTVRIDAYIKDKSSMLKSDW